MDVKEGNRTPENLRRVAVFDRMQEHALADERRLARTQEHVRQLIGGSHDLIVSPEVKFPLIVATFHAITHHAENPNGPEQVVDVGVRDEQVVDGMPIDARPLELGQDAVPAARIDEECATRRLPHLVVLKHKARIVAFCCERMAGAQHR